MSDFSAKTGVLILNTDVNIRFIAAEKTLIQSLEIKNTVADRSKLTISVSCWKNMQIPPNVRQNAVIYKGNCFAENITPEVTSPKKRHNSAKVFPGSNFTMTAEKPENRTMLKQTDSIADEECSMDFTRETDTDWWGVVVHLLMEFFLKAL